MAVPILSEPHGIVDAFRAAWMRRDGAAIAALFTEDADFVNVTGLWWHGRAAIGRPHDDALKSFFAKTELRAGRTETRMLGPDVAVVRCRLTLSGQKAPDGHIAEPRQTILTFVMMRQDAGWLAVSAQNTDVVPGQETHLADRDGLRAVRYRQGHPPSP